MQTIQQLIQDGYDDAIEQIK